MNHAERAAPNPVHYSAPVDAKANRRRLQASLLIWLTPTLVFPLLGGLVEGHATFEKIVTAWLMPVGVCWILLLTLTLFLWNQRLYWSTRIALLTLAVFTLASNGLASSWLIGSLERRHAAWRLDRDEPLDVVIVLGGHTRSNPAYGRVEAYDRVLYGAEIYLQNKTKRLITTGASGIPGRPDPSTDTKALWMRLGIPEEAITTVGGPNTSAEMAELKKLLADSNGQRIGLLTSAYHLPRAMRLAKAAGLDVIPVAADHFCDPDEPLRFQMFVPSGEAIYTSTLAMKEYLAALVGR